MKYPEFLEDKQFIKMDSSISENEQLRAMLNNLTRVHLLTANKFDSFDQLIREYLICGIDIFGLETGIVSKVDDSSVYQVLDVISPLEVLHKGQEFPLEDTYCREVINTKKVLGFPQVGKLDYMNCHPVYQNLKLEAYLSSPIYVGEKLFGTLNFTSVTIRESGFSQNEHDLILLMANSIGNYILLRSKEERLVELNDKMRRFVGFVAHDLRNPIGGIIGLSRLANRHITDQTRLANMLPKITETAQTALELVNNILDHAALSTGKLSLVKKSIKINELISKAGNLVTDFARESNISIDLELQPNVVVVCDSQRIQQAIVNLLINAIKYSPKGTNVAISSIVDNTFCRVTIKNKVALDNTVDSSVSGIYESIGFGIEIVNTILKAHCSDLDITQNKNSYTASFLLPLS